MRQSPGRFVALRKQLPGGRRGCQFARDANNGDRVRSANRIFRSHVKHRDCNSRRSARSMRDREARYARPYVAGPDHAASLEPHELTAMIKGIRIVEAALGDGRKEPAASERNTADVARRSLVAAYDLPAEALLTEGMIAIKRPGTGLSPALRQHLIGRRMRVPVSSGTVFTLEMLQ